MGPSVTKKKPTTLRQNALPQGSIFELMKLAIGSVNNGFLVFLNMNAHEN